ncbi:MAG: hypothetical protein QMD09_02165 [Desulfatibacillaceae bacterium]|nr:hypothetical protein [Desulfatibacillaceae bacterium]
MERLLKDALVTRLMRELRQRGSWCGETHIQKANYFLQELFEVPLDFRYTLYWYGPFSFDLRDELTAMRADGLIQIEPVDPRFGPRLKPTDKAEKVQELFPRSMAKYGPLLEFVANKVDTKNVAELERFATGLFVTRKLGQEASVESRKDKLMRVKPHVKDKSAIGAIQDVDSIIREAQALMLEQAQAQKPKSAPFP